MCRSELGWPEVVGLGQIERLDTTSIQNVLWRYVVLWCGMDMLVKGFVLLYIPEFRWCCLVVKVWLGFTVVERSCDGGGDGKRARRRGEVVAYMWFRGRGKRASGHSLASLLPILAVQVDCLHFPSGVKKVQVNLIEGVLLRPVASITKVRSNFPMLLSCTVQFHQYWVTPHG